MSGPELKPCPFCGDVPGEPIDATRVLGSWRVVHRCRVIPAFSIERSDLKKAIDVWNTRATSEADALRAENRELALEVMTASREAMDLHEANKRLRATLSAITATDCYSRDEVTDIARAALGDDA